ncbi:MAG: bifunctional demethylmenaquinone methyltransferase/2-methoxy-6-polyprenyl-1,4-benzoquinol methylase UbiE [Chloroflexota bacterium]
MSNAWPQPHREAVARMFGAIADRYDLMNRLMTFGQDQKWRRQAVDLTGVQPGADCLDVATGTGDLAFELAARVLPGGSVAGVDLVEEMLIHARQKASERALPVAFEQGDVANLPYPDNSFDAVTCGFGLRNFEDRTAALIEMTRVVRPGCRVVILELTPPSNALAREYMDQVVPRLGQLIAGAREAYTYLPASVKQFPDAPELGRMLQEAGLRQVTYRLLNFGTIALHWGTKPRK